MGERKPQQDVEFKVKFELIPPSKELEPVQLESNSLNLGAQRSSKVRSFIWKQVDKLTVGNVEEKDTSRVFCGETGDLLLCFHHADKNPYDEGTSEKDIQGSLRYATGYNGMISFNVRKDLFSQDGRRYIRDSKETKTYFNISDVDEFAVVFEGESQDNAVGFFTAPEFVRETHGMAIVNARKEILASMKKALSPLITNINLGDGSEFQIDVAPGVDWTAILAIIGGFGQDFENLQLDSIGEALAEGFASLKLLFGWQ